MVSLGELNPFGNFNFSGIFNTFLIIAIVAIVGLAIGGIGFFLMKKKKEAKTPKNSIIWWEETADSQIQIGRDEAVEIVHPGTRLRAFYIKKKDMWLPRFTRAIQPGLYYITITPQRELVNWVPKKLSEDMAEMGLKYDHTDMLWAAENLREFVKRNYRDKAIKWWQAYQGIISVVIFLIFLTICMAVVLYMMRGIVGDIGTVANQLSETIKASCNPGSGFVPAG